MGRAWLIVTSVLILIIFSSLVSAADNVYTPAAAAIDPAKIEAFLAQNSQIGSYTVGKADLDQAREELIKDYQKYSDEQWIAFDAQIKQYMMDFRKNVIVGILGVNALIAGFIFYYLNKQNKALSYESVSLTRQKREEERQYVITQMNAIKDYLGAMEKKNRETIETYVVPIQRYIDEQEYRRREQEAANQAYARDFQQGGYGGEYGGDGQTGSGGSQNAPYGNQPNLSEFPMEGEPYSGEGGWQ